MKSLFTFLVVGFISFVQAQTNVSVQLIHELQGQSFNLNQTSQNNIGHTFQLSRMEYYLTRFTIIHDGGQQTVVDDSVVFLVRANNPQNMSLGNFNVQNIEGIKFHVGVHTPTNHEDPTQYSTSHPLGPKAPSMHWGWTAGYRFIALEGWAGSQFNQKVELHGLGDGNYHETTVMATATASGGNATVQIYADYARGLENIAIQNGNIVHGETGDAALICSNFRDYVFRASSQAGLADLTSQQFKIFPIPSNGSFEVSWEGLMQAKRLEVINQLGQVISAVDLKNETSYEGYLETPGTYIIAVYDQNNRRHQNKLVIQ